MNLEQADQDILKRALDQLNGANTIVQFLSAYFRDKYKLTPDNQITPTGEIVSVSELRKKEKQIESIEPSFEYRAG